MQSNAKPRKGLTDWMKTSRSMRMANIKRGTVDPGGLKIKPTVLKRTK